MGMYESVIADCPKCGAQIEFQSKGGEGGEGGECEMRQYHMSSVPPEVARYVVAIGGIQACRCGELLKLKLTKPLERVQMELDVLTINTQRDYDVALSRLSDLIDQEIAPGSNEEAELKMLADAIESYERNPSTT